MPLWVRIAIRGCLMEAHGIRERDLEEIIVARADSLEDVGPTAPHRTVERDQVSRVALRDQKYLKGPNRPERDERQEGSVLAHNAALGLPFEFHVIAKETGTVLLCVGHLRILFSAGLVGNRLVGPNLAMWMRVAAPHDLATILKDLDIIDVGQRSKVGVLMRPDVDDCCNLLEAHTWQSQVVAWRKTHDPAGASLVFGNQQFSCALIDSGVRHIGSQRGKIVGEDKSRAIVGITDAASALVARTKIAAHLIARGLQDGASLNVALPWSLCTMRRNQHPFPMERVEAPMRHWKRSTVSERTRLTVHPPNPPPVMRAPYTPSKADASSTSRSSSLQLTS